MKITKKAFADILGKRLGDRIIFAHLDMSFEVLAAIPYAGEKILHDIL